MARRSSPQLKNLLRRYRGLDWFILLLLFGGLIYLLVRVISVEDHPSQADFNHRAIAIDGDSLKMNGVNLRLEGIDAVEYRQTCKKHQKSYPCGKLAYQHMKKILRRSQNQIKCILKGLDKYKRTLAVCYPQNTINGSAETALSLNAMMVRDGWAILSGNANYRDMEKDAKSHKRGIWAGEFIKPQKWRDSKR